MADQVVPCWRQPSTTVDSISLHDATIKRQKMTDMLKNNLRRETELTSADTAGWEVEERRSAYDWCISHNMRYQLMEKDWRLRNAAIENSSNHTHEACHFCRGLMWCTPAPKGDLSDDAVAIDGTTAIYDI